MSNLDLAAAYEITRRVYEYAYGIDTRDWSLYRSIFTDEIDIDFSSYNGAPAARMRANDWVGNVQILFTGLAATQHSMTNPLVDQPDPNNARCRMYMQAEHFLHTETNPKFKSELKSDNDYAIGGYYDNKLNLTSSGWRISAVTLNVLWQRGNKHIMEQATALGAQKLGRD